MDWVFRNGDWWRNVVCINADTVLTYTIVILVIIIIIKSTVFSLVKSSRAVNRVYWDFWFDLTRQIDLEDVISFSIFRKLQLLTSAVIVVLHRRLCKAFVRRVAKEPRCRLLSRKWSGIKEEELDNCNFGIGFRFWLDHALISWSNC